MNNILSEAQTLQFQSDKVMEEEQVESSSTHRVTSEGIEKVLYKSIPVLDHGFIRVIDYMGSDGAIVQAARVSYGKGTKTPSQDQALINYLMRHKHTSPFEMCEIKLHIKMPIFIARQWIRHRTASLNEYSARYSVMSREFYLPSLENVKPQSANNKQGRGGDMSTKEAQNIINTIKQDSLNAYDHYLDLLNLADENSTELKDEDKTGVAREIARINLTLNYYTEMYWKIDLHNLLHFLRLRADGHAQYEIRCYADAILEVVKAWVPLTYNAFEKYINNAVTLSSDMMKALQRMIKGEKLTQENSGLSKTEWRDFERMFHNN